MSLLALVLTSPADGPGVAERLARLAGEGATGVVLARDGVLWAHRQAHLKRLQAAGVHLYALASDLEARGLNVPEQGEVEVVTVADMVDMLMMEYERSVTL